MIGGLSDDIRDHLESETEAGKSPSIDLGYLFDQVIPGLLDQSGKLPFSHVLHVADPVRHTIPARQGFRIRKSIRYAFAGTICNAISRRRRLRFAE
jgi:hypothetical protein